MIVAGLPVTWKRFVKVWHLENVGFTITLPLIYFMWLKISTSATLLQSACWWQALLRHFD
jgi:hypothetical protein